MSEEAQILELNSIPLVLEKKKKEKEHHYKAWKEEMSFCNHQTSVRK